MTTPNAELAGIQDRGGFLGILARSARSYQRLAKQELLACALILGLTLGLRAALLPWLPVPEPLVHDEFSYLLAGDTYAHGRLTNPPHPFWQHFETFHVLQQPTYASKYQPLQGLVLAVGQRFFGQPWIGVYLSMGVMCAAICWMLQGWISADWALFGALVCTLRVGVLSYWMNSYMGGAVPAIGGALALGAVARIWRRRQFGHSITWATGVAIVVLSRPYDAAVLAVASGAMLLWFLRKSRTPIRSIYKSVAVPALLVLTICGGLVAYNDYRVTSHPLTLPYQAFEEQYVVASMFTMMPLRPEPVYHHPVMRSFFADWNAGQRTFARLDPLALSLIKLFLFDNFFFPLWALMIPVLLFPYDLDTPEESASVYLLLVFLVMIAPLIAGQPHYGAIFAGVFYLRFLQGLSRLWRWRPKGRPVGRTIGALLAVLIVGELSIDFFSLMRDGEEKFDLTRGRDAFTRGLEKNSARFKSDRHSMLKVLEQQPGRQLVLVRYAADHNTHDEWVFNRADVDASAIVWAREMDPQQDGPFIQYFHDRHVWLLEPDRSPPQLRRYPLAEASQ